MSATTLTIVLQGLLALVPNNEPGGTNQMTVLMLDGNHSHGIECMKPHTPELRVLADNTECGAAECTANEGLCICDQSILERKDVWLEIQPNPDPPRQTLPTSPPRPIPRNRLEAEDIGYIANMAQPPFNLHLNPQYLAPVPPLNLFARLQFPFDTVTSCSLSKRSDGGDANIHSMGFRRLHLDWNKREFDQAMAQMVVASVTIPDTGADKPKVVLHLKSFGSPSDATITLQPDSIGYLVEFFNNTTVLPLDDPCDDGIARHFAMYYELAQNPPAPEDQLIPHLRLTEFRCCAEALLPLACLRPLSSPLDHPICPLAIFNP